MQFFWGALPRTPFYLHQPLADLSLYCNSFLDLSLTLHHLLKEPIKEILRQEDDFNKKFVNALPPKDEALIPSPKIDPIRVDTSTLR